ncbi:MAG: hypothetical protein ABI036_10495 [Fibrobacteria bacterium]
MADRMKMGIFVLSLLGTGFAQPILKTGECPTLPRIMSTGDNWSQFPIKPSGVTAGSIQDSLPPAKSINCVQVPAGTRAEIVASELTPSSPPGLASLGYLMYFTFDDRGRVWALDVRDYPNDIVAERIAGGKSRIVILEDANGDGAMDNFKVFYSGLNIATSLEWVPGGVVLTATPNIVFIPSTGDVAGTPKILWKGGSTGNYDTHGQTNSLFYGLDNWFYGHTGGMPCNTSGGEGGAGNGVNCGNGNSWRFKSTFLGSKTNAFETWTHGPANAHGIGQMENGEVFQSGATGSIYSSHSIRGGVDAIPLVDKDSPMSPLTNDFYLWEKSNTAVSGHDFYTARLLPAIFNTRLYVCEGATRLCHQDNIAVNKNGENSGSTWTVSRMTGTGSNVFASTDSWVAPLKVRTGPDAGLWVVDWNNYLFLHNPANPVGAGNAWNNALRVKHSTRLYRIVPSDGSTHPVLNLSAATDDQLVAALSNTNFIWRLQAQKILARKATPSAALLTSLENILKTSRSMNELGNDPAVTHAVWALEGMGQFESDAARWNPLLKDLLLHPAWMTRQNVLKAMPRTMATSQAISDQCSVNDDQGHVRYQALLALAASPNAPNEKAIWTTFQNVDATVNTSNGAAKPAAAAVTAAGITTAADRPCKPLVGPVNIATPGNNSIQPRDDIRFNATVNGFNLMAKRQLESGELVVYDLRGQVAFRSTYNNSSAQWSAPSASGLKSAVYFYNYRKNNGEAFNGKISVTGMDF